MGDYNKTVWRVGEVVTADKLNHAEVGIENNANRIASLQEGMVAVQSQVGSPLVASSSSAMTDHSKIYVYTGSQSGYNNGHWYYWNGSAWSDGGVYNSQGINTDTTLTQSGMAADAKATGDMIAMRPGTGVGSAYQVNSTIENIASGKGAFAAGAGATASGSFSLAFGSYTGSSGSPIASGANSLAFGLGSNATANGSVAVGQQSLSSGAGSFALGANTVASGRRSIAGGNYITASGDYQTVFGQYNTEDADSAFILGNGYVPSVSTVFLYQRAASAPAKPSGTLTYTVSSGAISGSLGSWSTSIPTTGSNPCYATFVTISTPNATYSIPSSAWSSPATVSVTSKGALASGYNTHIITLFKRSATAPTVPSSSLTYTFSTETLSGSMNGWSKTMPSGTDPVYITTATAFSNASTDSIASTEWSTPYALSRLYLDAESSVVRTTAGIPRDAVRTNIFKVDRAGNATFAGGITVGTEGGISVGNTVVNEDRIKNIINQAGNFDYHVYVGYGDVEFGDINASTGADNGTSNTKIRTAVYTPVRMGDEILIYNTGTYNTYVGSYEYNNGSYVYLGALKLYADTGITSIKIQHDSYIRFAIGLVSGQNITNNRTNFENALSAIKIIRHAPIGGSFDDEFEWGSYLVNDLENGLLGNDSDHYSHRSKHLYRVEGSNLLGIVFNPEDISLNENITVYVLHYNSDFTAMKVVSRYIDHNNPNFSSLVYDDYPYAAVFIKRETTQTTQFHAAKIVADKFISTSYLPDAPYTIVETIVPNANIEIRAVGPRYYALGFNYKVFGSVMTTGRLRLPPNYSMTGEKVPLLIDVHGSNDMLNWEATLGPTQEGTKGFKVQYALYEGYAVFDCYPWGDQTHIDYDVFSPILMPLHCRAYIEGIKYVCERFNVDINNVVMLAHSQGGYIGHWAYMQSEFPFRAVGLFAATTEPMPQRSGRIFYNNYVRQTLSDLIDFEGTPEEISAFRNDGTITNPLVMSFLTKNKGKICSMMPYAVGIQSYGSSSEYDSPLDELFYGGINSLTSVPQWMLDEGLPQRQDEYDLVPAFAKNQRYSKHAQCPVKIWTAYDDTQVSAYGLYAVYKYLVNGGSNAEFRVMPVGTGGHNAMNITDESSLRTSGTTYLGYPYTNMSLAWVEFMEFAKKYTH